MELTDVVIIGASIGGLVSATVSFGFSSLHDRSITLSDCESLSSFNRASFKTKGF